MDNPVTGSRSYRVPVTFDRPANDREVRHCWGELRVKFAIFGMNVPSSSIAWSQLAGLKVHRPRIKTVPPTQTPHVVPEIREEGTGEKSTNGED